MANTGARVYTMGVYGHSPQWSPGANSWIRLEWENKYSHEIL